MLEREEVAAQAAHDSLVQGWTTDIANAKEAVESKTAARAKAKTDLAQAQADLADTTATRDQDVKYLDDVTATCDAKKADFENRQKLRADEIEAVEKAIEILSSEKVKGNAEKHLPKLLQEAPAKGTALIQVRSVKQNIPGNQLYVAAFLNDQANKLGSRILSSLAMKVEAQGGKDPFAKVKKLIEELITRLMTEANNEAEHKGWCDKEMGTNAHTRKEKSAAVETLTAQIDELTADNAKITEEIKVLEDFYAKAAEATSLSQTKRQDPPPEIFDEPYKGAQAENGGVVGMLEVILSDFERLESETTMP